MKKTDLDIFFTKGRKLRMLSGWEKEYEDGYFFFVRQDQYLARHKIGDKKQFLILK